MTPNTQTSSGLSNSKPAPVDRAKQLAATLLSERGEASGAQVARELHHLLRALDADDRHSFQRHLATEFQPDKAALRTATERYLADTTAETAAALAQAADPPRQEVLRRMNMAPGATGALIAMRSELTARLHDEPELKLLDADLRHLFASWFNRGFLELRRIDWQSPAAVLEKLIAHEAVHEIKGWDDLRRRLAPDRRCFAFFHPALPGEPLIFVEVALVPELERDGWWHDLAQSEKLRAPLLRLCARYLTRRPSIRIDPVARFHLGNGARLERINWLGNSAPRGIRESFGIMVNYLYDRDAINDNHEAFVRDGAVVRSPEVDALLQS